MKNETMQHMNTSNLTIYIMKTKNHIGFLELSSHHFRVKVVNSHVLFEQQWKKNLKYIKIIQTRQLCYRIMLTTSFIMLVLGV